VREYSLFALFFNLLNKPIVFMERHFLKEQHPRKQKKSAGKFGDGAAIFQNGVDYVKKNL